MVLDEIGREILIEFCRIISKWETAAKGWHENLVGGYLAFSKTNFAVAEAVGISKASEMSLSK